MKYSYETKFGTFEILPDINNGYSLWIKDNDNKECRLGWYPEAFMAADDVFICQTGFVDWDNQLEVEDPTDLEVWTKLQ